MKHNRLNLTRRGFLKSSAMGMGATVFGGPLVMRGSAASTAANSKLNLALVGCGGQGRGVMRGLLCQRREPGGPVRSGSGADRQGPGRRPKSRRRGDQGRQGLRGLSQAARQRRRASTPC